jgi:hypothetical protein
VAGRPVWDADLPDVVLDGLDSKPLHRLPVTVEAEPRIARRARRARLRLAVRVHELYGRLAAAGPLAVDVELRHRDDGRLGLTRDAALNPDDDSWTAEVLLGLGDVAAAGGVRPRDVRAAGPATWDVRVRVRCADGSSLYTAARATGPGLRRAVVLSRPYGLLLIQPYATVGRSLALRIAAGPRAAVGHPEHPEYPEPAAEPEAGRCPLTVRRPRLEFLEFGDPCPS